MTIERPMFPPRAESVDSISHQPAICLPENKTLTSESPKPDDKLGMAWWNSLSKRERTRWMREAGDTGRAKDAWEAFKRSKPTEGLSRRSMLGALAVLPATLPAVIATDPAFAALATMQAANAAHGEACDAICEAEERYGVGSDEAEQIYDLGGPACAASSDAAWSLAKTVPTSLAGIVAVLRFANQFEDEGMLWPYTIEREGWHYQLRASIATAIEAIIQRGQS